MWNRLILMMLLCGLLFVSCKTKRKVVIPVLDTSTDIVVANAESIKTFEMSNLDFRTFSGRAKAKIELGKRVNDVTLNIRIERDKAIWLSVTAMLGVEVARVMITPDSVKIINRLQGEYIGKPFAYIYNYTNQGITFVTLQDLLMANVSSNLLRTDNIQVASATDEYIIVGIKEKLSYQYRINKENRPFSFVLQEVDAVQNLEAFYGEYAKTKGYNFPQDIALNIVGEQISVRARWRYGRVSFNEEVEMPFSVSDRFKVIE